MRPLIIALGLMVSTTLLAQDNVEITIDQLAGNVFMLVGAGGNIGLSIGDDGIFMIDDQYAPLTDAIREAIGRISDADIDFVLNTHWHGDHTGGNENLGEAGVIIIAHDNVRRRMSAEQIRKIMGGKVPAAPAGALPVVTFSDNVTFYMNGDEIHAIHVAPAHTDSDSIVVFGNSNVIHMGDVFFNQRYPFIDIDTGGSLDGVFDAVDLGLSLADDDTVIIPGHGPVGSKQDLQAYRDMLSAVVANVAALIEQGNTLDQVIALNPTGDFDETWTWNFIDGDTMAKQVYYALTGADQVSPD